MVQAKISRWKTCLQRSQLPKRRRRLPHLLQVMSKLSLNLNRLAAAARKRRRTRNEDVLTSRQWARHSPPSAQICSPSGLTRNGRRPLDTISTCIDICAPDTLIPTISPMGPFRSSLWSSRARTTSVRSERLSALCLRHESRTVPEAQQLAVGLIAHLRHIAMCSRHMVAWQEAGIPVWLLSSTDCAQCVTIFQPEHMLPKSTMKMALCLYEQQMICLPDIDQISSWMTNR